MCGIIGCVSTQVEAVAPMMRSALKRLEYRGYDSVGVATLWRGVLHIKKNAGTVDEVHQALDLDTIPGAIGIGHTRWATHGKPNQINAHPHVDCGREVAVAHNGIIENYVKLREALRERGHRFVSETDTEVIPHLIEEGLEEGKGLEGAVRETVTQLEGSFAIATIATQDPEVLVCARHESPLILGIREHQMFCASDVPAFLPWTNQILWLRDGEIASLTWEGVRIIDWEEGVEVERKPQQVSWTAEMSQKGGYPHFMLKEIHEQPRAIRDTIRACKEEVKEVAHVLNEGEHLYILAAGTSYHAGMVNQYQLAALARRPAQTIIASEFGELAAEVVDEGTVILGITQSGETMDTLRALRLSQKQGVKVVSITNVLGSSVTRLSEGVVYMRAGPEIGVAATKTYTAQLTVLTAIAIQLGEYTGEQSAQEAKEYWAQLWESPTTVQETLETKEIRIKSLAAELANKQSCFYLARGINVPTALEGALKLKEIAYIHAEGNPAGESKHGPLALVEPGYPTVFIVPNNEVRAHTLSNLQEMKARGAWTITINEKGDEETMGDAEASIEILPTPNELTPLTYVIPLQLLAYYTAVARELNVDKPRNLAKSVTVL